MNIIYLLKFFFFNKKKYKPKNSEKKILVEVLITKQIILHTQFLVMH